MNNEIVAVQKAFENQVAQLTEENNYLRSLVPASTPRKMDSLTNMKSSPLPEDLTIRKSSAGESLPPTTPRVLGPPPPLELPPPRNYFYSFLYLLFSLIKNFSYNSAVKCSIRHSIR